MQVLGIERAMLFAASGFRQGGERLLPALASPAAVPGGGASWGWLCLRGCR